MDSKSYFVEEPDASIVDPMERMSPEKGFSTTSNKHWVDIIFDISRSTKPIEIRDWDGFHRPLSDSCQQIHVLVINNALTSRYWRRHSQIPSRPIDCWPPCDGKISERER